MIYYLGIGNKSLKRINLMVKQLFYYYSEIYRLIIKSYIKVRIFYSLHREGKKPFLKFDTHTRYVLISNGVFMF